MELFINDTKIDFTLEEEKTLGAVIAALEAWLAEQKLLLASLKVNGQDYDQTLLNKNTSLPIEEVSKLEITAADYIEFFQIQADSLNQYFSNLKAACQQKDLVNLDKLLPSFSEKLERLDFLLGDEIDLKTNNELKLKLQKLFSGTTAQMVKHWDTLTLDSALKLCANILAKLEQRKLEFSQLNQNVQKLFVTTFFKLREIGQKLTEVSLLLQTGKDGQAMQIIINFAELTQLFLQLAANLLTNLQDEKEKFEGLSTDLNIKLKELLQAFQKRDFVLIGDICEYEISPKLNLILDLCESFIKDFSN